MQSSRVRLSGSVSPGYLVILFILGDVRPVTTLQDPDPFREFQDVFRIFGLRLFNQLDASLQRNGIGIVRFCE